MTWSLPAPRLSMRLTLAITLGLMGALALILALTTGEFYRNLALDNQRDVLAELAGISAREQLHDLEDRARDLGRALQSDRAFRAALVSADRPALARAVRAQFSRSLATASEFKLVQIAVYDLALQPQAGATGTDTEFRSAPVCPALFATGRAPQQPLSVLCLVKQQARFAVLIPLGDSTPLGVLEIVTDPLPALAQIEERMGFAVRLRAPRGEWLYASPQWPSPAAMQTTLVGEHALRTPTGEPVLHVALLRDVTPLYEQLHRTRYLVMTLALAATVLAVLLALVVLEKTALRPLGALAEQLRRFGRDRSLRTDGLRASGVAEIRELTQDFNDMAQELGRLYGSLEHMAFTDPLTNLPNRARFHDSLAESTRRHARKQTPFALLLMDLDRFKQVNDTLGHQVGDLLLQEVSLRLKSVLRESDTITRLVDDTANRYEEKMVARLGGDEFAAILPGVTSHETAAGIARKLLTVMQTPFMIRGQRLSIGMSIGIALYPEHGEDIDTLMQRADAAMYAAKHSQSGFAFAESMQQESLL